MQVQPLTVHMHRREHREVEQPVAKCHRWVEASPSVGSGSLDAPVESQHNSERLQNVILEVGVGAATTHVLDHHDH